MAASEVSRSASSMSANNGNNTPASTERSAPSANVWQMRQEQHLKPSGFPELGQNPPAGDLNSDLTSAGPVTEMKRFTPVADAENWPEVGKAQPIPTPPLHPHPSMNGVSDATGESTGPSGSGGTHRKGEKTKWVAIPAEELQAAADELRPRRSHGSQNQHQRAGGLSSRGSRSGSVSRAPSTGRQNNNSRSNGPSGYTSAGASTSVSQNHSRATSQHGSPRGNGRGRRLPDLAPGPPGPPFFDPNQHPNHSRPGYPPPPNNFYPPFYPPPGAFPPFHGSPHMGPGYPLTPDGSFAPPQMYPPYPGQGYSQPYGYWPPPPQNHMFVPPPALGFDPSSLAPPPPSSSSSSISALVLNNSSPPGRGGSPASPNIPPRASHARPGPPSSSRPLAGYREIEPVASPVSQDAPLNFGSVGAPGSGSPQPRSPLVVATGETVVDLEKSFQSFAIGLGPEEDVPSRSRSATKTVNRLEDSAAPTIIFGTTTSERAPSSVPQENDGWRPDDFAVRDFGYGFGAASGSLPGGRPPRPPPPSIPHMPNGYMMGRPRRTSNADRGMFPPDRRPRGRGMRGGGGGRGRGGGGPGYPPRFPPVGTPPNPYAPLPGGIEYYAPPGMIPYGPMAYPAPGYDPYLPPPHLMAGMPVPMPGPGPMMGPGSSGPVSPAPGQHMNMPLPTTAVPFLDATQTHLLGQLEYYLSAENMAQDFYLRQQMDAEGWIPVALLAGFKRIQTLTVDPVLVREMLRLSNQAELDATQDRVRMALGQWTSYLLPREQEGAPLSHGPGEEQASAK